MDSAQLTRLRQKPRNLPWPSDESSLGSSRFVFRAGIDRPTIGTLIRALQPACQIFGRRHSSIKSLMRQDDIGPHRHPNCATLSLGLPKAGCGCVDFYTSGHIRRLPQLS